LKIKINNFLKILFFIILDILSVYSAIFIGLAIRLEGNISQDYIKIAFIDSIFISAIFIIFFFALGIYRSLWRYAGSKQYIKLIVACMLATAVSVFIEILLPRRLPLSVLAVLFFVILLFSGGIRISYRVLPRFLKSRNGVSNQTSVMSHL